MQELAQFVDLNILPGALMKGVIFFVKVVTVKRMSKKGARKGAG